MKFLIASLLMISTVTHTAKAEPLVSAAVFTGSISAAMTAPLLWECVKDAGAVQCLWPFTSTTVVALLKEEINQVEQDAHNALAGEDISLALAEVIEIARQEPSLTELSDLEVVTVLVSLEK